MVNHIRSANNAKLEMVGEFVVGVEMGGVWYDWKFAVIDGLFVDMLLGMDLMQHLGAVIDYNNGMISWSSDGRHIKVAMKKMDVKHAIAATTERLNEEELEECARLDDALAEAQRLLKSTVAGVMISRLKRRSRMS